MREYILTEHEREILETYLKEAIRMEGFRILIFRIRRSLERLRGDIELIETVLSKV